MKESVSQVLIAGAAVAVFYAVFSAKKKTEKVLDTVVAKPIADTILAVTLPGAVELRGTVQLPNGTRFPLDSLRLGTDLAFTYKGARYRIVRREGNTYYAVV